ncbi:MAG: TIM barrel protein [Chthoniobacteraceae bacterium]
MSATPILFHTIAVEPARWTPQRVTRPLVELLPAIAEAGFHELEIFEPHLTQAPSLEAIGQSFARLGMTPVMLSSYLTLNPAQTSDQTVAEEIERTKGLIETFGFQKMRVFAGGGIDPKNSVAVAVFRERIELLASRLPGVELLIETHDDSIAEDPEVLVEMIRQLKAPKAGLLFQPTFFDAEKALAQIKLEAPYIRHLHLQNRNVEKGFEPLATGLFSWPELLAQLPAPVPMTLEFTPAGICSVEDFDLAETLAEAKKEIAYIEQAAR